MQAVVEFSGGAITSWARALCRAEIFAADRMLSFDIISFARRSPPPFH
jgi:hypothetical protein